MSAADVSARLDRSAVSLDETVQLVLESDGKPGSRPDLSVLAPDFEILDRRVSHNVSVVNGERSERHILMLRLRPLRTGDLTIPPIGFGDRATASLQLSVTAPSSSTLEPAVTNPPSTPTDVSTLAPTVLLEASLEPKQGYAGQQFVLTAKVFMDGPVQGPQLRDPRIPGAGILPLGEDSYQSERDGTSYRVYERRYAIFPRDPGRLEIGPLSFEGWAPSGDTTSGVRYAPPGQSVHAISETLTAQVLPAQDGARKANWLPARSLSLTESGPQTYRTRTGQPIERRISLRADGVMGRDLPALAVQAPYQINKRRGQPRLTDERRPEGVIGTRQEIILLTTQEPGHYRLPPVSLDWWNTTTERWETAMLPARDLVVSAIPIGTPGVPSGSSISALKAGDQLSQSDQTQSVTGTTATTTVARDDAGGSDGLWIWITIVLALTWVATMAAWWRSKRRTREVTPAPSVSAKPPPTIETTDPLRSAVDAVRAAYQAGDAGAAREALLAWAEQALPEHPPSNLARLAQRCPQPLRGQILLLEQAFFSPNAVDWDKQPVWEGLEGFEPAPLEEPASFRRGKPIRHRAANPDAE